MGIRCDQIHYRHVWNCHSEVHYFAQISYTNKKNWTDKKETLKKRTRYLAHGEVGMDWRWIWSKYIKRKFSINKNMYFQNTSHEKFPWHSFIQVHSENIITCKPQSPSNLRFSSYRLLKISDCYYKPLVYDILLQQPKWTKTQS